jgi:hypothetical protein
LSFTFVRVSQPEGNRSEGGNGDSLFSENGANCDTLQQLQLNGAMPSHFECPPVSRDLHHHVSDSMLRSPAILKAYEVLNQIAPLTEVSLPDLKGGPSAIGELLTRVSKEVASLVANLPRDNGLQLWVDVYGIQKAQLRIIITDRVLTPFAVVLVPIRPGPATIRQLPYPMVEDLASAIHEPLANSLLLEKKEDLSRELRAELARNKFALGQSILDDLLATLSSGKRPSKLDVNRVLLSWLANSSAAPRIIVEGPTIQLMLM